MQNYNLLRVILSTFVFMVLSSPTLSSYHVNGQEPNNLSITQGIASGEVTDSSAVVWSRVNRQAQMYVEYDTDYNFSQPKTKTAVADRTTDFAATIKLEGLEPDSLYYYRIWFTTQNGDDDRFGVSNLLLGSFSTAPDPLTSKQINFVIGGDLGGQGFCRRNYSGYPIFSEIRALAPDFFLFNGDQIYADDYCTKNSPKNYPSWQNIEANTMDVGNKTVNWANLTQLHDIYLKHWEYNRNDTHLQSLLQSTSMYSQPDDHEVIDNYGGSWSSLPKLDYLLGPSKKREGYSNLVKTGIDIFFNFAPIKRDNTDPNRIYRSFNWGKDLDLFILDNRSYRDRNTIADIPGVYNKTMLGNEQLEWLKEGLLNSNATWKIVSTSVPITIPTCFDSIPQGQALLGCDSWASDGTTKQNFVRERTELLKFLDDNNIKNMVFVSTEVHSPSSIIVDEDINDDGDKLIFHELISGPLSAIPGHVQELDPTINSTYLYSEGRILNFGHIKIEKGFHDKQGLIKEDNPAHLIYKVFDEKGVVRPNSVLDLPPL